jgi:hypothetical protein
MQAATLALIMRNYYWPRMSEFVRQYGNVEMTAGCAVHENEHGKRGRNE